jgi:hypothetical protein
MGETVVRDVHRSCPQGRVARIPPVAQCVGNGVAFAYAEGLNPGRFTYQPHFLDLPPMQGEAESCLRGYLRFVRGLAYRKNQSGRRKGHEKEDDTDHQELTQAAARMVSETLQIRHIASVQLLYGL